jgi:hypothetical protein
MLLLYLVLILYFCPSLWLIFLGASFYSAKQQGKPLRDLIREYGAKQRAWHRSIERGQRL